MLVSGIVVSVVVNLTFTLQVAPRRSRDGFSHLSAVPYRGRRWSCGVPENARGILGCFGMLLVYVVKVVDLHPPLASAMLARARRCLGCRQ